MWRGSYNFRIQPALLGRCYRCLRPRTRCYCDRITPFPTRTRFAICIHPEEYRHQKSGTGRLCGIALEQAEIFVGISFDENEKLSALLDDPTLSPWLLYPGAEAVNLSTGNALPISPDKELLIVILDGTWRESKKMLRESPRLAALPRLAFTPSFRSRFRFKRQPHPSCLSTIEAVHEVLGSLETSGYEKSGLPKDSLLEILEDLVAWQMVCRKNGHPRKKSERRTDVLYNP